MRVIDSVNLTSHDRVAMRIIAGKWRSRKLIRPRTDRTRPMPDRVREAIFNMLGAHYGCPGTLPPLHVADVFAGSGSMGLESLSRGAASCRFFERGRTAVDALQANLAGLGAGSEAVLNRKDAWTEAARRPDTHAFELVFLDPPYVDSQDSSSAGRVMRFLAELAPNAGDRALLVLHHRATVAFADPSDGAWRMVESRKFGTNGVTIYTR